MAIADDVSVAVNGDIRWTGGASTQYTVLQLHRFLQDLADNASSSGDDLLDITSSTPSERSTDNIITLLSTYNIDDTMAQHLYDGSITQSSGDVVYSGLVVVGAVNNVATQLQIVQNNAILPNYWGAGINTDASANILLRTLVKTRTGGADIDGKRVRVQARELADTFAEFSVTMGLGNSVAAIFTNSDLNNQTVEGTIAGWTTISNVEGYQGIDLGNGNGTRYYYSQWNKASYTINQLYERTKWLQMRALEEDSHTGTGKDNPLGNGTITGQAQSFAVGTNDMKITRARFRLKRTGSPTGNITAKLYTHSGVYGTSSIPSGAALVSSATVPATRLRTSYDEHEFVFSGASQQTMTASANYCIALEYTAGDGSNYVNVDGVDTTGHSGNRASYATATWTADATDDLWFKVYSSPVIEGMSGELFRGITHQWDYTGESGGPYQEKETLTWGTGATAGSGVLLALYDAGTTGTLWIQLLTGVPPAASATVTGVTSNCTSTVNGSPTARSLSPAFLGQSTGTSLIGAFGIGVESADLSTYDKLFDLTNTMQQPPNNVIFTVSTIVSGDYVLVGPKDTGNAFKFDQLTLNTSLSGGSETAVVVTTAIPADTPASGTIRIQLNSGIYRKVAYTSWAASTFTIAPTDFSGDPATAPKNVMISYIDKATATTYESFTAIYSTDRNLWVRVRNGGGSPIKTYEGAGTLGSAGGGVSATRTADT